MSDINYQTVAAAAEALEKLGMEPSVRTVREKLGGGSNTTLAPMVRQWKEARAARLCSNVQLNPAISDLIIAQIAEVASQAANDANISVHSLATIPVLIPLTSGLAWSTAYARHSLDSLS